MTNETKIGLLVGLAFIIVVGILLSPSGLPGMPDASLTAVGNDVRTGTATLHNGSTQNEIVPPPAPPTPSKPVLTRDELREETKIVVTPGGPAAGTGGHDHPPIPDNSTAQNSNTASNNGTHSGPADTNEGISPDLEKEARQRSIELQRLAQNNPPTPPAPPAGPPTVNGIQQYVAEPGDTVSKLAGRYMGGNTKTNREAIIALNPTLKQNPNNIIVGRSYAIPSAKASTVAGTRTTPAHPVVVAPAPVATPGPQYFYTVKENDNLWKIAANQLGDGTAWATIKELNKDVLKGGEAVRPNMRLRLPAKPVASIQ